ncbi:MAG: hypothetical protein M0Z41_05155 [Peptococcaceae bacterium]|jgi:hypothetical protein|nr:hypothetical protein [Peptococcaceae bacterium]
MAVEAVRPSPQATPILILGDEVDGVGDFPPFGAFPIEPGFCGKINSSSRLDRYL